MIEVAALYVDCPGVYYQFDNVDCWSEINDATKYDGPYPVIAHPPCAPWGSLAGVSKYHDRNCAIIAIDQVQKFGGILEHPANSKLFRTTGLPLPNKNGNKYGFTVEIDQVFWGHPCRKRTWLYIVGIERSKLLEYKYANFDAVATHVVVDGPGILLPVMKPKLRSRTPILFAKWLIELTRDAKL
jgi:hypothetical protein